MKISKWIRPAICLTTMMLALGFTACSSDDDEVKNEIVYGDVWGEVLRGDNMTLQFYPDHFAYYWEYTFDATANPGIGLVIEGQFPDARFLSYNVYDDDEQTSYCERPYSLLDVDIKPDAGSSNPFADGKKASNRNYTIYVLPTNAPQSITAGKENIIWFDSDVKKVCTILRYYIPEGGIQGGVGMPVVKGLDLRTGKNVKTPERVLSGLHGSMEIPGAAFTFNANMVFFRAPFSFAYPNGPAEYCYCRNVVNTDNVMVFNFKAPSFPKDLSDFGKTDMRYWSVCVGNEDTYTPLAISDYQTKIDANGFANYILADKNNPNYAQVKAIAEANGYNILEWDNKAWGDGVMILYRNMVFADDYAHSLRKLDPVGPGVNPMANPQKYLCILALGEWGATGKSVAITDFIAADGKIQLRQPAGN
ncbi:MAG: hypothetical protein K2J10_11965 [Muribaculaceae bacterium]|nr:hypothetical protein [Muribaculaceae bacterium]